MIVSENSDSNPDWNWRLRCVTRNYLWSPIIGILVIGWGYLMTSHSFLIWYGLIGILFLLSAAAGILLKLRRK